MDILTDAKNQSISYGYDNINRMVTKCFGSNGGTCTSNKIAFTYNGDQIATITDSYHKIGTSNQTYTYTYDARHRLANVSSPTGTVTYTYTANNNDLIASMTDGTKAWNYAYYPDGSLNTIIAPEGNYTYSYNKLGQASTITYPNGSSVNNIYDGQNRVTDIQNKRPDTSIISDYLYTYDTGTSTDGKSLLGMISAITELFKQPDNTLIGPVVSSFSYDPLYQLTSAIYPDYQSAGMSTPPSWNNQTHSWSYDGIGNRTDFIKKDDQGNVLDTATYSYNKLRLTGITHTDGSPASSFTFDDNGNLATELDNGISKTYTWNLEDKLTGIGTSDNSTTSSYIYAYNGDRLRRVINAVQWDYLYSNEDILKISEVGTNLYLTQGAGIDDILAETLSGITAYAYKNHLSSLMQLTNPLSSTTQNYFYDSWGNLGNWPNPATDLNPYSYTGREWDAQNLHYYRARYYEASNGRFLSVDPLMETYFRMPFNSYVIQSIPKPYSYVDNNPIRYTDPKGEKPFYPYNYCGPGANGPIPPADERNPIPRPINPTDWCCYFHDLCYYRTKSDPSQTNPFCFPCNCDMCKCVRAVALNDYDRIIGDWACGLRPCDWTKIEKS